MSLCTPKLPRIIVSKGNHMSQDTIIRRSPIRGSGRICKFYPFPGSPPRRELRAATHPKRATKTAFRKCKRRIERHFWGTLPLRFPVRPPTAPLFHLHRMRITFRLPGRIRPYGPSPGLFPEFHRIRYADLRPWHVPVYRSAHPACGCADRPDNKLRNRKHVKKTPCGSLSILHNTLSNNTFLKTTKSKRYKF